MSQGLPRRDQFQFFIRIIHRTKSCSGKAKGCQLNHRDNVDKIYMADTTGIEQFALA
jgi:hypothetical protein